MTKANVINPVRESIWIAEKLDELENLIMNSEYQEVNRVVSRLKEKLKDWVDRGIITAEFYIEFDTLLDNLVVRHEAVYIDKEAGYKTVDEIRQKFNDEVLQMVAEYIEEE